jgi:DNA-binding NarL/FixJ family response regulator
VRIAILEDDRERRENLSETAEDNGHDPIVVARDVDDFYAQLSAASAGPDLYVLDIQINADRRAGIDVIHALRTRDPEARILAQSGNLFEPELLPDLLRFSAHNFGLVTKQTYRAKDLAEVYRRIEEGQYVIEASVAARMREIAEHRQGPLPKPLTAREREILSHVASGWTNEYIATQLFITTAVVNQHVGTAMRKLGINQPYLRDAQGNKLKAPLVGDDGTPTEYAYDVRVRAVLWWLSDGLHQQPPTTARS